MTDRDYRIVRPECEYRIELHVLARAYRDACVPLTEHPPTGRHRLEGLGVILDFGTPEQAGVGD